MKRKEYEKLLRWKSDPEKKPLILQGARQVGKTFLINEFGKNEYKSYFKFNFEEDEKLQVYFQEKLDPNIIVEKLSLHSGKPINPNTSLIFFDEIQVCPRALTSLKYFYENAPQYHIIAAGSLLGVSVGKPSSFPVGKVNFLDIHPLGFYEYLLAIGEDYLAHYLLEKENHESLPEALHEKMIQHFRTHLFLGGMPEVVQDYIVKKDPMSVRRIQNDILKAYRRDFSKYNTPLHAIKISEVWASIPYQMAKENKKFKYSDVRHKARASQFEGAIHWLKSAGLIHVVEQMRDVKFPLGGYVDVEKFKIYLLDTGLMGAMLKLTSDVVLSPTALFQEFNGGFVENYVCTELIKAFDTDLHYWTYERGNAEVDFIFQYENIIVPLEIKSGTNKNTMGLRNFEARYKTKQIFRTSPRNLHHSGTFTNIPLYWLFGLKGFIKLEVHKELI